MPHSIATPNTPQNGLFGQGARIETIERLRRDTLASMRVQKLRVDALLRPFGLRMQGFEVRGWRISPLKQALTSLRFGSLTAGHVMKRIRCCSTTPTTPQARMKAFLEARQRESR
jgi:hypothetical protein